MYKMIKNGVEHMIGHTLMHTVTAIHGMLVLLYSDDSGDLIDD